jgi:two-component system, LuxR family, sensor histidine kinase TtrS
MNHHKRAQVFFQMGQYQEHARIDGPYKIQFHYHLKTKYLGGIMKKKLFSLLCFCVLCFQPGMMFAEETYKIGVLANDGPIKAVKMWKTTADYLTGTLKGKTFEIVPLEFSAVNQAIQNKEVQFFLINSSMFVTAQAKFGAVPIVTMVNSRQGKPCNSFGGVIFTRTDNKAVNTLQDLKGKSFMGVEEQSLGGWQMAHKELVDAGLDPKKDFKSLEFGGKHENVVLAVLNGAVDAGTVRTDTLERMTGEGVIDMSDLKVIHPSENKEFPFVCSTVLYPEWPLAKIQSVPDEVSRQVAEALKQLKPDHPAAKDSKVVGWTDALDYKPVMNLQKALGLAS